MYVRPRLLLLPEIICYCFPLSRIPYAFFFSSFSSQQPDPNGKRIFHQHVEWANEWMISLLLLSLHFPPPPPFLSQGIAFRSYYIFSLFAQCANELATDISFFNNPSVPAASFWLSSLSLCVSCCVPLLFFSFSRVFFLVFLSRALFFLTVSSSYLSLSMPYYN